VACRVDHDARTRAITVRRLHQRLVAAQVENKLNGCVEVVHEDFGRAGGHLKPSSYQAYASGAVPPGPGKIASIDASVSGARVISRERSEAPSNWSRVRGPMIGHVTPS